MVLAVIRYLGICKGYLLTKSNTIKILVLSSVATTILIVIMAVLSDMNPNNGYLFCPINIKPNAVAKTIEFIFTLLTFLFLIAFSVCYFNIGRVYYKGITSLEESVLNLDNRRCIEFNSLEVGRQPQIRSNSSRLESDSLCIDNQNSNQDYKSKFQLIKLKAILKILAMITISLIEIVPISVIHFLNHFVVIENYEFIENICYWISEFIPLTNALMILFLHRETWMEFCNLINKH
jgi:hypothetical protein